MANHAQKTEEIPGKSDKKFEASRPNLWKEGNYKEETSAPAGIAG
jgi:hypothetical protein